MNIETTNQLQEFFDKLKPDETIVKREYLKTLSKEERDIIKKIQDFHDFNANQLVEIVKGIRLGIDYMSYAKKEFSSYQMQLIRDILQSGYNIEVIADKNLNEEQMSFILIGITQNVNIAIIKHSCIPAWKMRKILKLIIHFKVLYEDK